MSDSYQKGWSHRTSAGHVGAILWKKLYSAVDDKYPCHSCVKLQKVKAHISIAECAGDIELLYFRGGNVTVDKGAKAGAALHPQDAEIIGRTKKSGSNG